MLQIKSKYLPKDGGSQYFREKRFQVFLSFVKLMPRPIKILDIGGTQSFWEKMNFVNEPDISFTLVNLYPQEATAPNFTCVVGDATNLSYKDKEFDIVFSNSVIEHLYTWENQIKMANEIRRIGKSYFIQTPNLYFPIEAHWLFPFFQFLPFPLRVYMTQHYDIGGYPKTNDKAKAVDRVKEVRLLSTREMKKLFPGGICYREKFYGLTKSIIMYKNTAQ
ncbi:MAG: class I SAM-dependent methyltransferase [Chitinophagaceae bacterium]